MSSPTLFDAVIVEKLTPQEVIKLQTGEISEIPQKYSMSGGFFKISELNAWIKTTWDQLVGLVGICHANNYLIKIWKRVDNVGNCKCVYAGDLSNYVHFEPDTIESLFEEWDYYVSEDDDQDGEDQGFSWN